MARPRVGKRSAVFPEGWVERNPVLLAFFWLSLRSTGLRALVFEAPPTRLRMLLVARWFRHAWRQWSEGKQKRLLRTFHPDVEGELFPGLGTYRGREGLLQAWQGWQEAFPGARLEMEELVDIGDGNVVMTLRARGQGTTSGVEIDQRTVGVWTVRDGMGVRGRAFSTKADALEAVGSGGSTP